MSFSTGGSLLCDEGDFRRFGFPPSHIPSALGNTAVKRRQDEKKRILNSRGTRLTERELRKEERR